MNRHGTCSLLLSAEHPLPATTPADAIGAEDHGVRDAAAMAAGAHAFIGELPEGYHTPVGEGGVVLTHSQALRLAIARVIAADPRSVVVDDPTGGLDCTSEAAVLPGLESLFRGRDVSVICASSAVRAAIARAANETPVAANGSAAAPRPPEDPQLNGLGPMLDQRQMRSLLSGMLDGDCLDVRVHSTRYKPGKNLVVEYGVQTSAGWSTAVAFASSLTNLERKATKQVRRGVARRLRERVPARAAVGYLPEVSALVQWMPLDVRLPVLGDDAGRLTGRLAKKGIHAEDAEPELLGYWPRRRAVLRFGRHVLKLYRDQEDFEQALRSLRVARELCRVLTPAYEGRLKARRVTVQEWLPGGAASLRPAASEPAGRVLADLHADPLLNVATTTPRHLLHKAAARARFVTRLQPELGPEVTDLLAELEAKAPEAGPLVTSHGNFYAGQFLADPGGLAIIDVDRLCRAAPAYDIASFAAHLAFGRPGDRDVLDATVDSVVTGYGARPADLAWYLSIGLLRRAAVPFRFLDEQWPDATTGLVDLARVVLR